MFSSFVLLSALASSAFATVFITSPTASSTFTGGQNATIAWQDSGASPSLADFGNAKVSIYTGNSNQQTLLQQVVASVNVATTSSIQFTPDPSIGPNGKNYFIRVESLALKDANNTQYPALSFSSQFTMAGMSGTFNSSVQAQIDGQSTAPIGGSTASSGSTSAVAATANKAAASTTSGSSGSATRSATSVTASASNGAMAVVAGSPKLSMVVAFGAVALAMAL